ncbi:HDOD domain-containing protein [Rhodoferax sp. 4810]|nr:HDOD domain-containing protein [Rhodoferax jenense]
MSVRITAQLAEKQMDEDAVGALIKDIPIPPRPVVVQQMQTEMAKHDPDMRRIAQIIAQDVGLTVAVLKMVNSPLYGLSRRAESVDQALSLIGLTQLGILVAALAMRSLLKGDSNTLGRFYDTSTWRTQAMAHLAKSTGLVDVAQAQTFGLFCDVGIPLLMHRFPNYVQTLKNANEDRARSFTAIEQDAHHTDHALIGALMAKTWGLSSSVALAIRLHHDYEVFLDPKVPVEVARMISMNILVEEAIQRYAQIHVNTEWSKGGDYVASTLTMGPAEVQEWIDQLVDMFANS